MIEYWQHIYLHFNPIAFKLGMFSIHWYGIMYALALLSAIFIAHWIVQKDDLSISKDELDNYIWWAEVGVILGARLGYIIFYDTHTAYYLTHPWQIFNPFLDGVFIGLSGFSYHGAFIGFLIATILYCKKYKISFWLIADIAALSVPLAYIFGRIGNFLNQELFGRVTDVSWGIYVDNVLRHPSQLYEAFLEGLVVFLILFLYRKRKKFVGELGVLYVILYSLARIVSEFFRQPDIQLGYLYGQWLTMGMLISAVFAILCSLLYVYLRRKYV